ncbi:PP2C family protein-serine/threonine phosphatase [Streptomyces stramineus]
MTSGFTVLAITCVSTANVVLVATRERQLLQSRSVAEAAQRTLLRPPPERIGPLRTAVRYLAAAAEARVGGDLYEALATPFGTRLLIGDVRGKGLAAIETAADVLGTFREAAQVEPDLAVVARRLDAAVVRRRPGEEFVTAALVGVPASGARPSWSTAVTCRRCCGGPVRSRRWRRPSPSRRWRCWAWSATPTAAAVPFRAG